MEKYVDGFLLPVPNENLEAYADMSRHAGAIWKEHGALDYRECVADDIEHEGLASFRSAAGAKEGETVVFAWILYPNRAERDRINEAVMADPRLKDKCPEGIFDFKRMCWGGFKSLVSI